MSKVVTIHDAKTNLSRYIREAKAGKPVYIGSYGDREVVLMAVNKQKKAIVFGTAKNTIKLKPGYTLDGIDPDIQQLFYGKDG